MVPSMMPTGHNMTVPNHLVHYSITFVSDIVQLSHFLWGLGSKTSCKKQKSLNNLLPKQHISIC